MKIIFPGRINHCFSTSAGMITLYIPCSDNKTPNAQKEVHSSAHFVPCHAALIVRASQGVNKIRRVGNDQVEFIFRVILAEVAAYNFHPIAPGDD